MSKKHPITGFRCDFRGHDLVITALGASPRGTRVFLGQVKVASFNPREPGNKQKVQLALDQLIAQDS